MILQLEQHFHNIHIEISLFQGSLYPSRHPFAGDMALSYE